MSEVQEAERPYMQEKPTNLPDSQPTGEPIKPITEVVLDRRATMSFTDEEVPEKYLRAILQLGAQAPSGYNLQPWRFVVVRDAENRKRLQQVAYNQPKVAQAPVVIICLGMKEEWKERADEVFAEGAQRGLGNPDTVEQAKSGAIQFVSSHSLPVWVNRHVMIAVTTMMIAAESYGFDTAPMEGFDAAGVKREFAIPDEAEVVALLAIGRGAQPDKIYPGRFELERIVYNERYGAAWQEKG
ncbi:MAG TPA: nitroreductase family protein [Pyrinomonadaceae bacterium]|nr:nitroreductase family protein [Pyrinomonadaceae bacterium]